MTVTAVLPRSSLHLALLDANDPRIDHVLYRDSHLREDIERRYPGKAVYLGREGRLPRNPRGAMRQIAENRAYYGRVREMLEPLGIERLILFLEGEPLERMIADWFEGPIELWEEGLSHYIDLTSPLWYAARGAAQIVSGFYPRGALRRRADRGRMIVRDRFERRNLAWDYPVLAAPEDAVLFIGSPLVDDGILTREQLAAGLVQVARIAGVPLHYLPHPREDRSGLLPMLAGIDNVAMAPDPHGLTRHVTQHGYRAFVAPVSTALLDLGAFDNSLFVPALFGEKRMDQALRSWSANPVKVAADVNEAAAFLSSRKTAPLHQLRAEASPAG